MTTFDIYSIADAEFLTQVLISLAMICKTLGMAQAVKIGMLLGVFVAVFQSIAKNAQEFPIGSVFLGYIIFSLMFVPKVTVQVIDTYTGGVHVIEEVPLGPAAAGGIISSMGRQLTDLFEVGYGPIAPHLNSNIGFGDSLKLLNDTRRVSVQPALVQAMNAELCGVAFGSTTGCAIEVNSSLQNYIKDCTLKKIDLGLMNASELQTIPYKDALKFDSLLHNTLIFDTANLPEGSLRSCQTAWPILDRMVRDATNGEKTAAQLASLLGITHISAASPAIEFKNRLQGSIDGLMPVTMSAQEYIAAAVIQPALNRASNDKSLNQLDGSTAIMVNAAIQQRNSQWAGEQTLFMSVVRPMMAFFEAFIYAISPIMAFLFVLGAPGIKFAAKYFLLLLWVQLWMPLLSIVNLYIYIASHRELLTIGAQPGGNYISFYALNASTDVLQSWLAVGGMLAASTPVLALMLIYGGAVTATSMASRMAGSDHINEKVTAPDPVSSAPVLSAGSMHTGNPYTTSSTVTNAPSLSASVGSAASVAKAAADSNSSSAQAAYSAGISNVLSGNAGRSETASAVSAGSAAVKASKNDTVQAASKFVQDHATGSGFTSSSSQKIETALGLAGAANSDGKLSDGKGGKAGLIGKIAGLAGLNEAETRLFNQALSHETKNGNSLSSDASAQASLAKDLQSSLARDHSNASTSGQSSTATNNLTQSASKAEQSQRAATLTTTAANQVSSSADVPLSSIAAKALQDKDIQSSINNSTRLFNESEREDVLENAKKISEFNGVSMPVAMNQAALQQLTKPAPADGNHDLAASRFAAFANIAQMYNHNSGGANERPDFNASRNDDLRNIDGPTERALLTPSQVGSSSPQQPKMPDAPQEKPTPDDVSHDNELFQNDKNAQQVGESRDQFSASNNESSVGKSAFQSARQNLHTAADNVPDNRMAAAGWINDKVTISASSEGKKAGENAIASVRQNQQSIVENNSPAENKEMANNILSEYGNNARFNEFVKQAESAGETNSSAYSQATEGLTGAEKTAISAYTSMTALSAGRAETERFDAASKTQEVQDALATPGLTNSQREILAGATSGDSQMRDSGIRNLYSDMAIRDENNMPVMNDDGTYKLTDESRQDAQAIVKTLTSAGDAGKEHGGSGINPVVNFNNSKFK